jgi:hypothetical protein
MTPDRSPTEGLRAAALRLGRGIGVQVQTPNYTRGNSYAADEWMEELLTKYKTQGLLTYE